MFLRRALLLVSLSAIVASLVILKLSSNSFQAAVGNESSVHHEGDLADDYSVSGVAHALLKGASGAAALPRWSWLVEEDVQSWQVALDPGWPLVHIPFHPKCTLLTHGHLLQAIVANTLTLIKQAQGFPDGATFAETQGALRGHLAHFIAGVQYISTEGLPSMPAHLALLQRTPLALQNIRNGAFFQVAIEAFFFSGLWDMCPASP